MKSEYTSVFSPWCKSARLFWHSGIDTELSLFQEQIQPPQIYQGLGGWILYSDYNFTTSCTVTNPGQHSHTTQNEHVPSEFKGESVLLWKKPHQRKGWKNEPKAVTGVFWKLGFKRPPFPSHSICSLTLPLTPQSLLFLLPSPELKQQTKDTLTSLQVKKTKIDWNMAKWNLKNKINKPLFT